jgi:very-short-patch-repair endonuclease/rRNA maturation protein Nop10
MKMIMETVCSYCGAPCTLTGSKRRNAVRSGRGFCSLKCRKASQYAGSTKPPLEMACPHCGKPVTVTGPARYDAAKKGRGYCSPECSEAGRRAKITATSTGREMPPRSVEWRAKRSALLKGRTPVGKNGNPTPAEAKLLSYLPTAWVLHYLVPGWKGKGGCIVDICEPEMKVSVEVDGPSHTRSAQKAHDAKKTAFLLGRGFLVLHVTNKAVAENPIMQSKLCEMLAKVRAA